MIVRRSIPLVLVVAFVVASVVLSDTMSTRAWMAGGHATPAQWALHQLYESLGLHDHHGHADVEAADAVASVVTTVGTGLAWSVAAPGNAPDPGQVARHSRDAGFGVHAPLTTLLRVHPRDVPQPPGPDFLALDPPPRFAA